MRTVLAALILFVASHMDAQERTLVWKALEVTAKLENDGTLRISERHRMLFNGDWNGGQREFRVRSGQHFAFLGMSRVDAGGNTHEMTKARGEGIDLHEYRLEGQTLRWRARRASDPPFRNAERLYVLDYRLRNILERRPEHYILDHDFAFPDRTGLIESLAVKLELDSAWQAPPDFQAQFERSNVPPGESAILTVQLQWTGAGQPQFLAPLVPPGSTPPPSGVETRPVAPGKPPVPPASLLSKLAVLGAFVLAAIALLIVFLRREGALGRFAPRPTVTPSWLEKHLLVHRAEVVGAAWDGVTGPGEVAALIAIMTAEGKLENVPGAPKLRLLVPRESLANYERGFVDALFIDGNEIDPAALRRHYREKGFRPATTIAAPLKAAASRLVGSASHTSWAFGCIAFALAGFVFPLMALGFAMTLAPAGWYRSKFLGRGMATAIPFPLLFAALLQTYLNVSLGWLIANLVAGAGLLGFTLRLASWRGSRAELRNLLDFRAARDFLRQRILQRDPAVDPRWIPYMLAFGLVPDDRWSVSAVPNAPRPELLLDDHRGDLTASDVHSPGEAAPATTFAAGGGSFGGAGATGSWASIQTFASTVAATPALSTSSGNSSSGGSGWSWSSSSSSSSSDSGGSDSDSGGGSSGGGGGGGW